LKTVKYFLKINWDPKKIHVFIDSETDDIAKYESSCHEFGVNLHVFDMDEARRRYDYVHRPSKARRSAGQARNMFFDYAKENGIDFYVAMDDDTQNYQYRRLGKYRQATGEDVRRVYSSVEDFMRRRKIGLFGLPQTGDYLGGNDRRFFIKKVMNTTFYLLPYVYRGERGVQDDDTSLFTGVMNVGLFTGSPGYGLTLLQTLSATSKGGLTDLYHECKLLNKALVCPIQFPSAIKAEKRKDNGGRVHHKINYRYLMPKILKGDARHDNIAWDTYPEDYPFTNEPKNRQSQ
jgi:hypothetical protein